MRRRLEGSPVAVTPKELSMGAWRRIAVPWHETAIINCSFCGKMIPRQLWVATHEGQERIFCSPSCESLFLSYWLPRHGASGPTEGMGPGR